MKVWIFLLFLVPFFALFGFCFDYSLWSIVGKDVPWYADVIAGTLLNAIILSVTVVCWILRLCGYPAPFIG